MVTREFHTEKKGLVAAPSVPCVFGVTAGLVFWVMCFTCSHSGVGKGGNLTQAFKMGAEQGVNRVCEAAEDVFDKPKLGMKRKKLAI